MDPQVGRDMLVVGTALILAIVVVTGLLVTAWELAVWLVDWAFGRRHG